MFARSLSLNVVIVTVHVAMVTWFGAQEKDELVVCTRNGRHGNMLMIFRSRLNRCPDISRYSSLFPGPQVFYLCALLTAVA